MEKEQSVKLVENARQVWRHYSTQALATLVSLGSVWAGIPEWAKSALPGWVAPTVAWVVVFVALFGLAGKFVDQTPKDPQ